MSPALAGRFFTAAPPGILASRRVPEAQKYSTNISRIELKPHSYPKSQAAEAERFLKTGSCWGRSCCFLSTCHSHSYCCFSCKPKYRTRHTKSQDDLCSRKNRTSDGLILLQEDELRKIRKWTKSKSNSPT